MVFRFTLDDLFDLSFVEDHVVREHVCSSTSVGAFNAWFIFGMDHVRQVSWFSIVGEVVTSILLFYEVMGWFSEDC